ncbi:MAG: lysylphosphatidylglycerol synthase transmembrane domain-containing protein [Eubacteriales bacterium]|nr:lysylphosphatidylglycerol synthase transmembrane domain-containing protein [Eubacteriales bacterium]
MSKEEYLKFRSNSPRTEVEAAAPRKLKVSQSLLYLLFMGLLLFFTFRLLFKYYDRETVNALLLTANPFFIFLGLAAVFYLQVVFGQVLLNLIYGATGRQLPLMIGVKTAMIGFFFNNITPSSSGGQPMEIYFLYRHGIKVAHSTLAFVSLSLYYYLSKLILGSISLLGNPAKAWAALAGYRPFFVIGSLLATVMAIACTMLLFKPALIATTARRILSFLIQKRVIKRRQEAKRKLKDWLKQYEGGSQLLSARFRNFIRLGLYFLFGTAVYYLAFYFCALAIGLRPPFFEFMRLICLYMLTASAIPTPGFIGLGESSFAKIFSDILGYSGSVATMIVARTVTLYFFLLIALGFCLYAFIDLRRNPFGRTEKNPAKSKSQGSK